jgi:hypothetical protein
MDNQVRKRLIAGFGEVDGCHQSIGYCAFCPGGLVVSYGELMRQGGRRNMFRFSPAQVPILHPIVLDPDLAQDLSRRDFSQKGREPADQTLRRGLSIRPLPSLREGASRSPSDLGKRLSSMRCP